MERKSIVIFFIVILLVISPLIILLYGQAVIEFFEPTVPRCTEIVVNFYSFECNNSINYSYSINNKRIHDSYTINNESKFLCSSQLIGIAELNETGYFIETSNPTLDKLLREKYMVWTGNCDGSVCWDGYAILVPGTTEYLGGINKRLMAKGFFSQMVVSSPENCKTCIEEVYIGKKCS